MAVVPMRRFAMSDGNALRCGGNVPGQRALCYRSAVRETGGYAMSIMTCIEDLRQPRAARCRARSSTMPRPAPIARRRCAPTAPTSSASSCASACWSTSSQRSTATTILGEPARAAAGAWRRSGCAACSTATARSWPAARRRRPASRSRSRPCRSARSRTSPRRSTSRSGSSSTS